MAELADADRYGTHTALRAGQPKRLTDHLGILLEHARAEEVPFHRYAWGHECDSGM